MEFKFFFNAKLYGSYSNPPGLTGPKSVLLIQ